MSTTKRLFPPPGSTFGDWVSWFFDSLFALAGLAIDGGQFVACAAASFLILGIFGVFLWAVFTH